MQYLAMLVLDGDQDGSVGASLERDATIAVLMVQLPRINYIVLVTAGHGSLRAQWAVSKLLRIGTKDRPGGLRGCI